MGTFDVKEKHAEQVNQINHGFDWQFVQLIVGFILACLGIGVCAQIFILSIRSM